MADHVGSVGSVDAFVELDLDVGELCGIVASLHTPVILSNALVDVDAEVRNLIFVVVVKVVTACFMRQVPNLFGACGPVSRSVVLDLVHSEVGNGRVNLHRDTVALA